MPKRRKVEFSPQAVLDLEDIADFIAEDNPQAAEAWVDRLVETAEGMAAHPKAGRVVPEVDDTHVREVLLGNYRIVYRVEPTRILVLTVIEGHRPLRIGNDTETEFSEACRQVERIAQFRLMDMLP